MTNKWMTSAAARLKANLNRSFGARKNKKAASHPTEPIIVRARGNSAQIEALKKNSDRSRSTRGDESGNRKETSRPLRGLSRRTGGRILSHKAVAPGVMLSKGRDGAPFKNTRATLSSSEPQELHHQDPLVPLQEIIAPTIGPFGKVPSLSTDSPKRGWIKVAARTAGNLDVAASVSRDQARAQDESFCPEYIERIVTLQERACKQSADDVVSSDESNNADPQLLSLGARSCHDGLRRFQATETDTVVRDHTAASAEHEALTAAPVGCAGFEAPRDTMSNARQTRTSRNLDDHSTEPQPIRYFNNGIEVCLDGTPLHIDRSASAQKRKKNNHNKSLTAAAERVPQIVPVVTAGGDSAFGKCEASCATKTTSDGKLLAEAAPVARVTAKTNNSCQALLNDQSVNMVQQANATKLNDVENQLTPPVVTEKNDTKPGKDMPAVASSAKKPSKRAKRKKTTKKDKSKRRRKSKRVKSAVGQDNMSLEGAAISHREANSSAPIKSKISSELLHPYAEEGKKNRPKKNRCAEDSKLDNENCKSARTEVSSVDIFQSNQVKNESNLGPHGELLALLFGTKNTESPDLDNTSSSSELE